MSFPRQSFLYELPIADKNKNALLWKHEPEMGNILQQNIAG